MANFHLGLCFMLLIRKRKETAPVQQPGLLTLMAVRCSERQVFITFEI